MGFPRKVKNQILVDTARHCCVCHRYKGVKVEVHHILQEVLGGDNTMEFIEIPVSSNSFVEIVGKYIPQFATSKNLVAGVKRNEIISHFLRDYSDFRIRPICRLRV